MALNLRTTICINMLVLTTAAIGLISLVVFRVSEREIRMQQQYTAEQVFASVAATISSILRTGERTAAAPQAMQPYINRLVHELNCDLIIFTDRSGLPLAQAGHTAAGAPPPGDREIASAISLRDRYHALQRSADGSALRHVIAGPVYADTRILGYLKIAFPLAETGKRISDAARMILMYVVFDAVILYFFGTFLLSRYVVRPIRRLTDDMHSMAGGLIEHPQLMKSKNEIGSLSATLKTMYQKLRQEQQHTETQLLELARKNRQLEQAHAEILQSEKLASVGRLATGIAHEIGNPAGILIGYIHMLKESGITDDERRDFLQRMESEAGRINATIRELLDFAQPSSRDAARVDLNEIIRDTGSLLSYQREFKNIKTVFELADCLPMLYANAKLLQQLMVNLILNAKDAMTGGGTLCIETRFDDSTNVIQLEVADTGCGIPQEHLGSIFDPFFTTKEPGKGTGLGLSNAHRIVELCGGTISAQSTSGSGTRFTITFPVRAEAD